MKSKIVQFTRNKGRHVCPWWIAYLFDNPLRRLVHPPEKIVGPYVTAGMILLDFGCGFGHYTLGMARLTGPSGKVVAADIQQKMLDKTMARAKKAGLEGVVQPLLCSGKGIGAPFIFDFALASNSIHETPDRGEIMTELFAVLRPGGRFFLMEPRSHMTLERFESEVALAESAGFVETERPRVIREMSVLFENPRAC